MTDRNIKVYLKDILEAMEAIEKFVKNMNFEEFRNNDLVSSAVIRKFEIIGEAARNIPQTIKSKLPELKEKIKKVFENLEKEK
jgi:uncharacterized protein with HEPN domain